MYQSRYNHKKKSGLFDLKGRFSLIHLGGGSFLYSFPGRTHPIVGKVELSRKKYRTHGLGFLAISGLFIGVLSLLASAGTASSTSELHDLDGANLSPVEESDITSREASVGMGESSLSPEELQERSEALKTRILEEIEKMSAREQEAEEQAESEREDSGDIIEYSVRSGDTLSGIAQRYRVPMSMIAESSGIQTHAVLRPGQKLTIPNRPGLIYSIKRGDRLAKVADYYSVKLEEVLHDNPELANLDLIPPGTRVFLPNAKIPEPPPIWVRPASGRISSNYGWRRHPITRRRHLHAGIDVAIAYGTVRAARDGTVVFAGRMGGYGNAIIIRHDSGFKTLYAHLSRFRVRRGQSVNGGQPIAISGNTGMSTGPHLHFELRRNNRPVNPRRYINF